MKDIRKLRVLQLGKLYYPTIGGIEKTMQQIAEGINCEVDSYVLAAQPKGKAHSENINGVSVYYAASSGVIASMPISWDLVRYLKKHRDDYDIIHLHMPFPLGDVACLLSGFKGKIVIYWHSDIIRQKNMMIFYKPIMEKMLKRADVITVATQGNINGSPYIKPYEYKCRLIPFGITKLTEEKSDIYQQKKDDNKAEESSDKLNLLFIGRLVYYKGIDILLKAMSILKDEPVTLTVIGDGNLMETSKNIVKEEHISDKVCFMGKVSDEELNRQIEKCDVFVFPSVAKSEAFGLVQIEAMAYGKPVINTSLETGVPWVSIDKKTGLTVEPGNIKELAEAIAWLKDHPDKRMIMGEKARERVKEEFTQDILISRILNLYREIVAL